MIKTDELKGIITKNGYSQNKIAQMMGMAPKTFYGKMKKGVFGSDEIEFLIKTLDIKDPIAIFFANE